MAANLERTQITCWCDIYRTQSAVLIPLNSGEVDIKKEVLLFNLEIF